MEFKSSYEIRTSHVKNLKRFAEDYPDARLIIVSQDKFNRKVNGVENIYVYDFLKALWKGEIILSK